MKPPFSLDLNVSTYGLRQTVDKICHVLRNISFGGSASNSDLSRNISGLWASFTTPATADTEFSVAIDDTILGHIPLGFLTLSVKPAGVLYVSTTAWTTTTIYLKCNAASVVATIFVI